MAPLPTTTSRRPESRADAQPDTTLANASSRVGNPFSGLSAQTTPITSDAPASTGGRCLGSGLPEPMSKNVLPCRSLTSNICRKEFSAAAIHASSSWARKATQFLPKANRSPDSISAACWVIFSFIVRREALLI
jgi:hypothetical protein